MDAPFPPAAIHGRGTALNPPNRFQRIHVQWDATEVAEANPRTEFYEDDSRSILSWNKSPDIPFEAGINPYRGCEHGCAYCYARQYHEYLGYSAGLDFETRILVKTRAAELLRAELMAPSYQPTRLALCGATDAYQPVEARLRITRGVLEVLAEFGNPVGVITKNALVTRDIDLLGRLARHNAAAVAISLTTLDETLRGKLEPRTSTSARRLQAIRELAEAGIPVGVNVAPVIPGLNDHEIPAIMAAARAAGARWAGGMVVRLPHAVADVFTDWLQVHVPQAAEKVLRRLRELRGGQLNDSRFGKRMKGEGTRADTIARLLQVSRRKNGLADHGPELSTAAFRRPGATRNLF